jgi:endonuclease/exonuclease/phosphatase family metal-dependent hydrolase
MSFLQIGSWNIEHLGGQARGDRKQSAFALAEHIEMSGIDVIALQELYVTPEGEEVRLGDGQPVIECYGTIDRRNSDLDVVCYLLEEHLDLPWRYHITPNRSAGDKSQLCGVLWNTERLKLEEVVPLDVAHEDDGDNLWDRTPHLFNFSSDVSVFRRSISGAWERITEGRRFSLVPLHMKSNYGGVTKNRRVRAKEAATLCAALAQAQARVDPSLILIGDTNILSNAEPAIEIFLANGLDDLNNNDSATYWSHQYNEAPFDRCFVRHARPEFRFTRQYIMRSSDLLAHDRFLSDHYMIKVSVKDYVDDADTRSHNL